MRGQVLAPGVFVINPHRDISKQQDKVLFAVYSYESSVDNIALVFFYLQIYCTFPGDRLCLMYNFSL